MDVTDSGSRRNDDIDIIEASLDDYDSMADYEEHMASLGDPDLEARPTPVEPEAPPDTLRDEIEHRIWQLITEYGDHALSTTPPRDLAEWIAEHPAPLVAVEPDGLPLDVPDALRKAWAFIGGITPDEWATIDKAREAKQHLDALSAAGAPSEDEQPR